MFPMDYVTDKPNWVHPRACKVCKQIKCKCDKEEVKMRQAIHDNCTIAPALRVCGECRYEPTQSELEFNILRELVFECPPEPETAAESHAALIGDETREFPWRYDEVDDYREKRKQEWKEFLARMNAPEMVERRGTELTPYGWRLPD